MVVVASTMNMGGGGGYEPDIGASICGGKYLLRNN